MLFNSNIKKELKDKLLKNWKWYNKKSAFIKNNNDYDISII